MGHMILFVAQKTINGRWASKFMNRLEGELTNYNLPIYSIINLLLNKGFDKQSINIEVGWSIAS